MASEIAKRDQNSAVVLTGITDDANQEIRMLRVNPATGRLQVSSISGGSSGFQQPTSGAVNGSNTVFVWATAPNVIVVDQGRTMQATNSAPDLGINWTGTTTTTLTIAPTFDIFAIA